MKIIIGLGNPGEKYKSTRHNVGYLVLDKLAKKKEISPAGEKINFKKDHKFNSLIASTKNKGQSIILVKPETYMNTSGDSVSKIMQYYRADILDLVVVYDDVDIPLGQIRLRLKGSSAGHNGAQSIIDTLGSDQFVRIRIGISDQLKNVQEIDKKENKIDTKNYVLSQFSKREMKIVEKVADQAAELITKSLYKNAELKAETLEIV